VTTPHIESELLLVDLPGMVAEGHPQADAVRRLIHVQCSPKSTLVVAAGKTENDDDTDLGFMYLKQPDMDPGFERTMRVHTFWADARQIQKKRCQLDILEKNATGKSHLAGHVLALKKDFSSGPSPVMVSNQIATQSSHPDIDKLVTKSTTRDEEDRIQWPPKDVYQPGVPAGNQGIAMMTKRLSEMLGPLVRRRKGELLNQFEHALNEINEKIKHPDIGEVDKDNAILIKNKMYPIQELMQKELRQLSSTTKVMIGFANNVLPFDGEHVSEMDIGYWETRNDTVPGFEGYEDVLASVRFMLVNWQAPIRETIDDLQGYYCANIYSKLDSKKASKGGICPDKAIDLVKEKWKAVVGECIAAIKKKLLPPERGGTDKSVLESCIKFIKGKAAQVHQDRDLQYLLNPKLPLLELARVQNLKQFTADMTDSAGCAGQAWVNGQLEHVDGLYVLTKLKKFSDMMHPDVPFEVDPKNGDGESISFGLIAPDSKSVPDTVKHLMITRCRIKMAVKAWVGEVEKNSNGQQASGAYEEMKDQIVNEARLMNDHMRREMVDALPLFAAFTDQLGEDPFASERKRLMDARRLIEEGIGLVKSLPDP